MTDNTRLRAQAYMMELVSTPAMVIRNQIIRQREYVAAWHAMGEQIEKK